MVLGETVLDPERPDNPEPEQLLALVLDQVSVENSPSVMLDGDALKERVGAEGGILVDEEVEVEEDDDEVVEVEEDDDEVVEVDILINLRFELVLRGQRVSSKSPVLGEIQLKLTPLLARTNGPLLLQ